MSHFRPGLLTLLCAGILITSSGKPDHLFAQSKQEMLKALTNHSALTRSLKPRVKLKKLKSLTTRSIGTRGISLAEKKEIFEISQSEELPSLNLEIYFATNSATISKQSFSQLQTLSEVINSAQFSTSQFLVFGHADARGANKFNLDLSHRRANAVKQYLASYTHSGPKRFVAIGYGEEYPKIASNPEAAENRRVQILNFVDPK